VDDRGGLENRCGPWVTVGSNPTPSANAQGLSRLGVPVFHQAWVSANATPTYIVGIAAYGIRDPTAQRCASAVLRNLA
jgi:hypothetical protein